MIIKRDEITDFKSLVGHIVLESLARHPKILHKAAEDGEVDVRLTIGGEDMDLRPFVEHWQSQVERMIHEEAMKQVERKFDDVQNKMRDYTDALQETLDSLKMEG